MATINGLEVKSIKHVIDHEGFSIPTGNLYYKNKKVGEFEADKWAGPMHYRHTSTKFTEEEIMSKVSQIVKLKGWDSFYDTFEILIHELIAFKKLESLFKKCDKTDYHLVVMELDKSRKPTFSSTLEEVIYEVPNSYTSEQKNSLYQELKSKYPERILEEYTSLDDFQL